MTKIFIKKIISAAEPEPKKLITVPVSAPAPQNNFGSTGSSASSATLQKRSCDDPAFQWQKMRVKHFVAKFCCSIFLKLFSVNLIRISHLGCEFVTWDHFLCCVSGRNCRIRTHRYLYLFFIHLHFFIVCQCWRSTYVVFFGSGSWIRISLHAHPDPDANPDPWSKKSTW